MRDLGAAGAGALATLPQAVAYGLIATAPLGADWAAFGITASLGSAILFGGLTGAAGSSRFLLSGPRAITALVLATAIQTALSRGHPPGDALALAFAGVVIAGLLQAAMGVLRLGHVAAFVPVPVLSGFVTASSVLVLLTALPTVLGLPDADLPTVLTGAAGPIDPWAIAVGGTAILVTLVLDERLRIVPSALLGLALGTAVYLLGQGQVGLPPGPEIGAVDAADLWRAPLLLQAGIDWATWHGDFAIPLTSGLSIGLLAAFDTVLTTSALDMRRSGTADPNHDLRVHGIANAAMGVLGFLPGSGALNRSMVMIRAGARTRMATVGTALMLVVLLLLLTPLVAAMPLWATAGMLVATALQAMDRATLDKAWTILAGRLPYRRVLAGDVAVTLAVVATAVAFDLIAAVGAGILLAVLLFVLGMGRDPVRRVYTGTRVHSNVQRPIRQVEALEEHGHRIAVIELQGALFFGTCARVLAQAQKAVAAGAADLVLDCRHVTAVDSTGAATVLTLDRLCRDAGGRLLLSRIEPPERRKAGPADGSSKDATRQEKAPPRWAWLILDANGVIAALGHERIHDDTDSALADCEDRLLQRHAAPDRDSVRRIITDSALFEGLDRDQVRQLGRFARRHSFPAGSKPFRQGDAGDRAFFLVSGRMDVLIDIKGSTRRRRVSVLTAGSLFGEMGLIDGAPRSARVKAVERSVCLSIDAPSFARLERAHPGIALILLRNVSRQFADRLRVANSMIAELEQ